MKRRNAPGAQWDAGKFTTPSLGELRTEFAKRTEAAKSAKRTTFSIWQGDVAELHGKVENHGLKTIYGSKSGMKVKKRTLISCIAKVTS